MKYLKSYNESIDNKILELQEFCESNLAYLIDDGFQVTVTNGQYGNKDSTIINIKKNVKMLSRVNSIEQLNNNFINGLFKWDDVKDDFIPFYDILSNKNNIVEATLLCDTRSKHIKSPKIVITHNDILGDKINDKIDDIRIMFNKKIVNKTLIHNIILKII